MHLYRLKLITIFSFVLILLNYNQALALEPGTLLYRTSSNGQMYGYSSDELIKESHGIINGIYPGHVGIYVGKENGTHYVVEALSTGVVKVPAHYFINEALGEKFVAAKIPIKASPWQRAKAVAIAKYLARADLAYDFNFSSQKGPWSGDWTCVGLVEKIYESANANNPERLSSLEYDPRYYAVDITPDGFDNISVYNEAGDVFSKQVEFSKIARRKNTILPAPEILGFNAGKEYNANRYIFLPYTQAIQTSLKSVPVDIELSSYFKDSEVRGKVNNIGLILKWSLINNPKSALKNTGHALASIFSKDKSEDIVILSEIAKEAEPQAIKYVSGELLVEDNPLMREEEEDYKKLDQEVINNTVEYQPIAVKDSVPDNHLNDIFSQVRPGLEFLNDKAYQGSETLTDDRVEEEKLSEKNDLSQVAGSIDHKEEPEIKTIDNFAVNAEGLEEQGSQHNTSEDSNLALWSTIAETLSQNNQANIEASYEEAELSNEEAPLTLLISRIHTDGLDDWIEIWNYGEEDIDLAAREIRLEKARTAYNPAIIIRFNSDTDAVFPGGTIIRAGGAYRIVREKASSDLLAAAHAIALRPSFTFGDNAYTIYLASGPVSSPDDEDIIDILGYGDAMYFEGSGPAPALESGYLLRRKADASTELSDILKGGFQFNWPPIYDSNDNARDFLLWPLGGELIIDEDDDEDDEIVNNDDEDFDEDFDDEKQNDLNDEDLEDDEVANEDDDENDSSEAFTLLPGFDQDDIFRLWSFSECEGSSTADMISKQAENRLETTEFWEIGRWGCGQRLPYNFEGIWQGELSPILSGENFSLLFSYKGEDKYAHPYFLLHNSEDDVGLKVNLLSSKIEFNGFPGLSGRHNQDTGMDNTWRQVALVWDTANSYWALYLDGEEKFFKNFNGLAPGFDILQLGAIAGHVIVDDIALWQKALSSEEIAEIWSSNQPLNPQVSRIAVPETVLKHAWNFDEVSGSSAHDSVSGLVWELPDGSIVYDGLSGRALNYPRHDSPYELVIPNLAKNNFSFSWWQQNNMELPYSGRLHLRLKANDEFLAEFTVDNSRQRLNTGGWDYIWGEGNEVIVNDNLWHHFALVYDDYHYRWQFFVDGELKLTDYRLPIKSQFLNKLILRSSVFNYKLDNFKIWQGALSPAEVLAEYNAERVD